jgi:hypothetical protein
MAQPAPQPRLTYQDLLEFPADGNRHEPPSPLLPGLTIALEDVFG